MISTDATKILVVDDLPEKLLVYRTILDELGQHIIEARSGEEALRHVLQHDFSVILLDVNMPTMNGFETARLIRQRKRSAHTPIIFVTAFADEMQKLEAYAHGAVDFILAPIVPEILRAKVRVFVELYRMNLQVMRQAEERIALAEERTKRLAAEEANRNLSFLAKCRAVLGQSLDFDETIRDLASLAVPYLADWSLVAVPDGTGTSWTALVARPGPGSTPLIESNIILDTLPTTMVQAVDRAFQHGRAEVVEDAASAGVPRTFTHVMPLQSRGRTMAVMAFNHVWPRGSFTSTETNLVESLTTRAAVALENAQLFMNLKEADRQRNEFLSMLAHELRNPLAPIRNAVELLRSGDLMPTDLARSRDIISRQVKQLVRLVDDLLDVSRITQGKIRLDHQPVEVVSVVRLAVEASSPEIDSRRHQLHVELPEESLYVLGDPTRLAQILTNLFNNAAKYTKDGGQIWLTTHAESENVMVRVRDTGIGIPAEMQSRVFDLFTQIDRTLDRSEGGLGIGLTLVRRLVEMHSGRVEVKSAGAGQGSEFTVHLPRCRKTDSAHDLPGQDIIRRSADKSACRVLIVDDNRDSADSLALLLRISGFTPRLAYDGHTALKMAQDDCPDIILLDIGLPGIDGFEVARRLRANQATQAVFLIAITGYGKEDASEQSAQAGFNRHMVKPVELCELLDVLNGYSTPINGVTPG